MGDEQQHGLDESFLAMLFFTTLTGLALLVLRHEWFMPYLLIVHLGTVLALFLTLPYGKFVHGLYRSRRWLWTHAIAHAEACALQAKIGDRRLQPPRRIRPCASC